MSVTVECFSRISNQEGLMLPWLWWYFAPRVEFPLSGNVTQDILLDRFFGSIKPTAGDARIERKAFEAASYGTQLGKISEVLLSLAGSAAVDSDKAKESLRDLEAIYNDIKEIKRANSSKKVEEAVCLLEKLKLSDPPAFDRVLARLSETGPNAKPTP
jgi:hypothetical protein